MTEELTGQLCKIQPDRLGVIARTTTMHFKNTPQVVAEIGKQLRVHQMIEAVSGARARGFG